MIAASLASVHRGEELSSEHFALRQHRLDTWLYFIAAHDFSAIKIGVARDPRDRLRTFEQASPHPFLLLALTRSNRAEERMLHRIYARDRLRGEWFGPTEPMLRVVGELRWLMQADIEEDFEDSLAPWWWCP